MPLRSLCFRQSATARPMRHACETLWGTPYSVHILRLSGAPATPADEPISVAAARRMSSTALGFRALGRTLGVRGHTREKRVSDRRSGRRRKQLALTRVLPIPSESAHGVRLLGRL